MHYSAHKERIVRIASHLFVGHDVLSGTQVDSILRRGLNTQIFDEPSLDVDHIRVGLVEYGLLLREDDGRIYKPDVAAFMERSNIRGIFGQDYPCSRIRDVEHLVKKISIFAKRQNMIAV